MARGSSLVSKDQKEARASLTDLGTYYTRQREQCRVPQWVCAWHVWKNSMEASAGQSERVRVAVKEVQGRRVGQISCWALQGTVRICFFSQKKMGNHGRA